MNKFRLSVLTALLLSASAMAHAEEVVTWWDFFGGGDGVRMRQIIDNFNKENEGKIRIQPTTLDFGSPFYTKVQTSTAVGEGPDIMSYDASHIPLGVSQGGLQQIADSDLAVLGLKVEDFDASMWNSVLADGKPYAIPMDTHGILLFYNKDRLKAAGLLDDKGLPKDIDTLEKFNLALKKLKDGGTPTPLAATSADDFHVYTATSLLCQLGGEMMTGKEWLAGDNGAKLAQALDVISGWVKEGYAPAYTEHVASTGLFTSGQAAFHINGNWEVPTFSDLASKGELGFEWGAIELPPLMGKKCTYVDTSALAIPVNQNKELTPEKRAAVLKVMRYVLDNGLVWATAGHIPALKSITQSEAFKKMEPNATYSSLTQNTIYDPRSPFAGVGTPLWELVGNAVKATVNGEESGESAVEVLKEDLQALQ